MTERVLRPISFSQARFYALIAPLASLVTISTPAKAETNFWGDSYQSPEIVREAPRIRRLRPSVLPKGADKAEKVAAEGSKPQGPLVIAISIQRQQVKVYDANGLFAESPISSGMAGHSTPMGVFSIIQKHKFHRSNIYSGAPMPYMQRITWSGVAMHAGVLPGYPASHGCIRMPMSFAMKMWGWTKMGARVVVAPAEVSPVNFAHPTLAALVPPGPVAAAPEALASANVRTADASGSMVGLSMKVTDAATVGIATMTEVPADVATVASIAAGEAASELRPSVDLATDGIPPAPTPALVDFSDVTLSANETSPPETAVAIQAPADATQADTQEAKTEEAKIEESKVETIVDSAAAVSAAVDVGPPAIAPVVVAAPATVEPAKTAERTKDQSQLALPPADISPAAAAPLIKRNSPVAIFVSRKDAKIYVRQNFTPLFDMPIEIAPGDKALGTHVFTARTGKDDEKKLQWSVVSLPVVSRQASSTNDDRSTRKHRTGTVEVAQIVPSTADEALARLTIPQDLMARLGDALPPGSSLVVSDQGITQGETGEGTDFIVRLK